LTDEPSPLPCLSTENSASYKKQDFKNKRFWLEKRMREERKGID
jgi:hypothetical protein